jgi:hypothetical protein
MALACRVGFAAFVLCVAVPIVRGSDDELAEPLPRRDQVEPFVPPDDWKWVFKSRSQREREIDNSVQKRIAIIDQICDLTEAQRREILLASRGDKQRLNDRIDKLGSKVQALGRDPNKLENLARESETLQLGLSAVTRGDWLIDKTVTKELTPEQRAKYEPLRKIDRAGGIVRNMWGRNLSVVLTRTQASDDVVADIARLPNVIFLGLGYTQVTDLGMKSLEQLPNLEFLDLSGTGVTDRVIAHVTGLQKLKVLDLHCTRVTDLALEHIRRLDGLESLVLFDTPVTDAGQAHLNGAIRLRALYLGETQITDAGLAHLNGLPNLGALMLGNTRTTDAGVAALQESKPGLTVLK